MAIRLGWLPLLTVVATLGSLMQPARGSANPEVAAPSNEAMIDCRGLLIGELSPSQARWSKTSLADIGQRHGPQLLLVEFKEPASPTTAGLEALNQHLSERASQFRLRLPPADWLASRSFLVENGASEHLQSKFFIGGLGQDLAAFFASFGPSTELNIDRFEAPTALFEVEQLGEHPTEVFNNLPVYLSASRVSEWNLVQLNYASGSSKSFYFLPRSFFNELLSSHAFNGLQLELHSWRKVATFVDVKVEGKYLHAATTANEEWVILPADVYFHLKPNLQDSLVAMLTYLATTSSGQ